MLRDMPEASIVIPCYNEARRVDPAHMAAVLAACPWARVCFVNDGSADGTSQVLRQIVALRPGQCRQLDLPANGGKAAAVRAGVLDALKNDASEFVGYWDADLATPLSEAEHFLRLAGRHEQYELLSGCRLQRLGASINRNWHRHYLGRLFASLASLTLDLPVYDTQCGAKLFRRSLAEKVFVDPFISKWCFDVELLWRIIRLRGREEARRIVLEVPLLEWHEKGGSTLRWHHCVGSLLDLVRIRRHYDQ